VGVGGGGGQTGKYLQPITPGTKRNRTRPGLDLLGSWNKQLATVAATVADPHINVARIVIRGWWEHSLKGLNREDGSVVRVLAAQQGTCRRRAGVVAVRHAGLAGDPWRVEGADSQVDRRLDRRLRREVLQALRGSPMITTCMCKLVEVRHATVEPPVYLR
jgi:hypothetical protein